MPATFQDVIVAPSVLAADFGHLADETRRAEAAGADWLHMDVMDGHFVDNISYGPAFVAAVHKAATVPLDVHLMIERPDHYFSRFTKIAKNITIHVEPEYDVAKTLAAIRDAGCTCGLAINPATPLKDVEPFLGQIDLLLVMTVHPGFGGQSFREECMEKVRGAAKLRAERALDYHIQVDGGINEDTGRISREAGANVFVAGTYVFGAGDIARAIRSLRP